METYGLTLNQVITSLTNVSNNVFTATIPILGAGTYNYQWTFSDTQSNANNSELE